MTKIKSKRITFSIVILAVLFLGFTNKNKITNCYISFNTATNLIAAKPDRLPEGSEKIRKVNTNHGEVEVTCIDGYRVLYNNNKKAPFVNLKVELSKKGFYEKDQKSLIENLNYLNSNSSSMETKNLIEFKVNGFNIYGLSRNTIENGSTLGIFVMFPGNDVTVYFYFNNLKPDYRNFESLEDYKKIRDKFIDEYTKYLKKCENN